MELLDKYIEELNQDTYLDEFNLKDAQLKLPGIKHKWAGRLIRSRVDLSTYKSKRWAIINAMTDKLVEESPVTISRPNAQKRVVLHDSIKGIDRTIQDLECVIQFLEKIERILGSMTFDIKNICDIMKLETQ